MGDDLVVYDTLDLTQPNVVVGQHSVWLPDLQVKVPFQFGGRIQKYKRPNEGAYPVDTMTEEVGFLQKLAELNWAPKIGRFVYFKNIISEHKGYWWCDPLGAYGYEMRNALTMPTPGYFDFNTFALWAQEQVTASPGAMNDINKPGNVINGYLIDVRRSWYDRLKWNGDKPQFVTYREDKESLLDRLHKEGSFPFRERPEPYQDYYLNGAWNKGERQVKQRATILGFNPLPGETVLDIGCQTGGFLSLAAARSVPGPLVGLDIQPEFITLARDLARANGFNICFKQADIEKELDQVIQWLMAVADGQFDHVLILSMAKHFEGREAFLFHLVDALAARHTYLESNAVKTGSTPLRDRAFQRGGRQVGVTTDRNERHCYKLDRK